MSNGDSWNQPPYFPGGKSESEPVAWWRQPKKVSAGVIGVTVVALLGYAFGASAHAPNSPATPTPAAASPTFVPSPTRTERTITPTPLPSPVATPSPASSSEHPTNSLSSVAGLEGNVGYIPADRQSGFLWGRAATNENINIMTLRCESDVPSVQLFVVSEKDTVVKKYPLTNYPDISPNPCEGDEVKDSVGRAGSTLGYYSLFLSVSIASGTLGGE